MSSYGKLLEEDIKNSIIVKIIKHLNGELALPSIKTRKFYIDNKIDFTNRSDVSFEEISLDRIKFATSPVTNFNVIFLFSGSGIVEIDLLKDIYTTIKGKYTIDNVTFVDAEPSLVDPVKEEMRDLKINFKEVLLSTLNTDNINDHTIVITINPQMNYSGINIEQQKLDNDKKIKDIINKTNIFVVVQHNEDKTKERLVNNQDQIFNSSNWPSGGGKYLRKLFIRSSAKRIRSAKRSSDKRSSAKRSSAKRSSAKRKSITKLKRTKRKLYRKK